MSITEIVDHVVIEMRGHLALPYALFGHSMGAIVAFELARRLRDLGLPPPAHLYASGARAPHLPRAPALHHLPHEAFVAGVVALGGLPAEIAAEPDLMEMLLPSLRADFTAIDTWSYSPAPPLGHPITALGGTDDPRVSPDHLAGWADHTTGAFRTRVFPGGHFYLDGHRAAVVDSLRF